MNELITNSNKYAFVNVNNPTINIALYQNNDNYILEYSDNGIGFDKKNLKNSSGLGFELIQGFIKKIHGKMELNTQSGIEISIKFKKENNG